MKDPAFEESEFLTDRVQYRQCLFAQQDLARLPGASWHPGGIKFTAPDKLNIELDHLDLSRFNRLCVSVLNLSQSPLLAGATLVYEWTPSEGNIAPLSFSGGREMLRPGEWVELLFPRESFGSYGRRSNDWREIRRLILSFVREKTDVRHDAIEVCLQSVSGEWMLPAQSPRLTEQGLIRVLSEKEAAHFAFRAVLPSNLRRLAMAIPPPHPYPQESADEILAGKIMGQDLQTPMNWNVDPLGIHEWKHFLHRCHFLRAVAQRLDETGEERYAGFLIHSLHSWIVSNPVPSGSNGGAGPSWETLTAAWRLREWIWILESLHSARALDTETWRLVLRSIWEHVRSLMDHKGHPNNWIIVESAAIALAGMAFPMFIDAPAWMAEGLRRLDAEFQRQFFADGAHYEISPLYHAISFSAYLDVFCAAKFCGISLPEGFIPLERCAEYLAATCRPNFTWPSINDSGDIAGNYTALMTMAGEVFNRPDLIWIGSKGCRGNPPGRNSRIFPDAGLVAMRSGFDANARFLIFRAGPPGMAHFHDDALSLEVAALGEPRLVDPGITTYAPGPLTDYYRSAAAHNTILIDGEGPEYSSYSERVKPAGACLTWRRQEQLESATGIYRNFRTGRDGECVVSRTVLFVDGEYWVICDDVMGSGDHEMAVCWQFFPGNVQLNEITGEVVSVDDRGARLILLPLPGSRKPQFKISSGRMQPPCGWVSLEGGDEPATHVRFSLKSSLPLNLLWLILPCAGDSASIVKASRRDEAGGIVCLEVTSPNAHTDLLTLYPPETDLIARERKVHLFRIYAKDNGIDTAV